MVENTVTLILQCICFEISVFTRQTNIKRQHLTLPSARNGSFSQRLLVLISLFWTPPILDTTQYKDLLGSVITDIVLAVLSFGAQLEVDTKSKAQAEGIAAAHLKGVKFGRPRCTVEGWDTYYPQWKQGQITAVQCYKQLGISASTFYRLVRKYELEDESK